MVGDMVFVCVAMFEERVGLGSCAALIPESSESNVDASKPGGPNFLKTPTRRATGPALVKKFKFAGESQCTLLAKCTKGGSGTAAAFFPLTIFYQTQQLATAGGNGLSVISFVRAPLVLTDQHETKTERQLQQTEAATSKPPCWEGTRGSVNVGLGWWRQTTTNNIKKVKK
jgi:hypothetical protein